ncbi:hypothetical protein JCM33374_g3524 [Metschnikowia sp. JCM 33374]|nr:hypothetical protein JCM33374_g3524 [Metschnikowia sp. JCM 33374]
MKPTVPILLLAFIISIGSCIPTNVGVEIHQNGHDGHTPLHVSLTKTLIESELQAIMECLNSFISWTRFRFGQFQPMADAIRRRIALVYDIFNNSSEDVHTTAQRLYHTENMFRVMVDAATLMEFYITNERVEQVLIYEITQLNVQLLMMYDSSGYPDLSYPKYGQMVASFKNAVEYWANSFEALGKTSPALSLVFHVEYAKANNTLAVLEGASKRVSM